MYQITTIPNGHKITKDNERPSKIYQNWYFGYENIPSGNPEKDCYEVHQK
jgi:hypothetical protein